MTTQIRGGQWLDAWRLPVAVGAFLAMTATIFFMQPDTRGLRDVIQMSVR